MKSKLGILFIGMSLLAPLSSHASRAVALIYNGPGVCKELCAESARAVAINAGLKAIYVDPQNIDDQIFKRAKVWIQPGGDHIQALAAMNPLLVSNLKNFIRNGGGYVGFCAGAIISTETDANGVHGFNIFPGKTPYFKPPYAIPDHPKIQYSIEPVQWGDESLSIYFEGGPYLDGLEDSTGKPIPGVEIIARYLRFHDGKVAAARTHFGKGRVFISGAHPEAPNVWWTGDHVPNDSGSVRYLAVEMVSWAAFGE